jgi:hypothetical protein
MEEYWNKGATDDQGSCPAALPLQSCTRLNTVCRLSDFRIWLERNNERTVFPMVSMVLEDDMLNRKFRVSQVLLHASSRVYEGLVRFQHRQREDLQSACLAPSEESTLGSQSMQITIPREVTGDAGVVEAAIFFVYTKVLYDVRAKIREDASQIAEVQDAWDSGGDGGAAGMSDGTLCATILPKSELENPSFTFDPVELFLLADYLGINELTGVMKHAFFNTSCLFSQVCTRWRPFYLPAEKDLFLGGMFLQHHVFC